MTIRDDVLLMLRQPMSVRELEDKSYKSRSQIRDALSQLRLSGCIAVHHTERNGTGNPTKFWVSTGKPFSAPPPRKPRPKALPKRRRSGVIAPSPYAYGYLWSNR